MTESGIVRVARASADDPDIRRAAALLREGELVAFPTETVYGLGAHALDTAAVAKIFLAKGRPAHNPVIVHVANLAAAQTLVTAWPEPAERLAHAFWPGPLTIVLPRRSVVPDLVTSGLSTVAIRIPSHPVALALLEAAGIPVAAPSANRSESVSPTTAEHVQASLGDRAPLILDGGQTEIGIESTVVALDGGVARLLRPGMITIEEIEQILGVAVEVGLPATGESPRAAPGQLDRHYSPAAQVRLYAPGDSIDLRGQRAAAIVITPGSSGLADELILPADPAGYARQIYAALHTLDAAGVAVILIERPPSAPAWAAIHDRVRRAAYRPANLDA